MKHKLNLVADENMPLVAELFSSFANVRLLHGREITPEDLSDCDILLVRSITRVDAKLLDNSSVKIVGSATAGLDHIDQGYLRRQKIPFFDAKGCNANSVAEFVIASLCQLSLHSDSNLFEKKLAVIGYGHVGKALTKKLEAFGIPYCVYDPILNTKSRPDIDSDDSAEHIRFCDWNEVMSCEMLSFHVPYEADGEYPTAHMINKALFANWQNPCVLINTSRGDICHEQDLIAALSADSGIPRFDIVWDVWSDEPNINPLLFSYATIATPHIAGYSVDAKIAATRYLQQKIVHFLQHAREVLTDEIHIPDETFAINKEQQLLPTEKIASSNLLTDQQNELTRLMLAVYNPTKDFLDLKNLMQNDATTRNKGFDLLRKEYPRRFESQNFYINSLNVSESLCERLMKLGFRLN